jgi:hypothetical protein
VYERVTPKAELEPWKSLLKIIKGKGKKGKGLDRDLQKFFKKHGKPPMIFNPLGPWIIILCMQDLV